MIETDATVFLVDDDESIRRAVARLLRSAGYRVETFSAAQEFLDGDQNGAHTACIVLDLQMPGLNGLDLQDELRARGIDHPIVFITGHGDIPASVRAMKSGAVDFLPKPVQDRDLLRAVAQAVQRSEETRCERAVIAALRARVATLTPREREVMELVTQGLLNKQIAARLGTVEKTVKVHRGRVMQKMQVDSLADLVRAVEQLGGTSTPS
jgi:FixJ family two-component response regulator